MGIEYQHHCMERMQIHEHELQHIQRWWTKQIHSLQGVVNIDKSSQAG